MLWVPSKVRNYTSSRAQKDAKLVKCLSQQPESIGLDSQFLYKKLHVVMPVCSPSAEEAVKLSGTHWPASYSS